MTAHFELEEQGAPQLVGDDNAQQPADGAAAAAGTPNVPVVEGDVVWSGEEAQMVLQTILNFGVFFYGTDWLCGPGDFYRSRENAAALLERVFPKATTGGPIGVGVDVAAVASDFGVSLRARRDLMKKGPKKGDQILEEMGIGPKRTTHIDVPEPPPAADQPVPAGESTPPVSSGFKFSAEVAAALGRNSQGGSLYSDMGLG